MSIGNWLVGCHGGIVDSTEVDYRGANRLSLCPWWRNRRRCGCSKSAVFGFGLTKYRDIRVGILPRCKEIIVGFATLLSIALRRVGARKPQLAERRVHLPPARTAIIEEHLELRRSLRGLLCSQVGQPETIGNVQRAVVLSGLDQQIDGFRRISSLASYDGANQRQIHFLFDGILGSNAVECRCQCFRVGEIAAVCECFATAPQLDGAVSLLRHGMAAEAAGEAVVSEKRFELGAHRSCVRGVLRRAALYV